MSIDCQGMNKQEAFGHVLKGLQVHKQAYLVNETSANSLGALQLYSSLSDFMKQLEIGLPIIGKLDEIRFVVGNQNKPKISPEEAALMLSLHSAVEQMVYAVRQFKQSFNSN